MKQKKASVFPFSWRDLLRTAGILFLATQLCIFLRMVDQSDEFVSLIFVLAVLLVSRLTNGYLFGLIASFAGVIGVNWIFTYPYLELNFTIAGYPLTFFTMLMVSLITCAMTTQIKQQQQLKMESETEKMRADLLRSVSHDIRTPLTSIVGATSAILDNPTALSAEEQRRLLTDVRDEAQWLIRVVENLLSVTRIGGERANLRKEPEAAEEILGEAVRKFRKRFPAIQVSVSAPAELLMVPMDPVLIEQVLSNLMENAVEHGVHTSEIRVSVASAEDWAEFSVADNGAGIPKEQISTIFDGTLRKAENPVGDGKRNMGLGLTVCLAIVRAHGGSISACNQTDGGAEFRFRLPLEGEETDYDHP